MRARPHHLIDIVCQFGAGRPFVPHAYGHAVHSVAEALIADPDTDVRFVVGADDICEPCVHLVDGRCDDVLSQFDPPISKQAYNDDLDRRLIDFLGMREGQVMTFGEYLDLLRERLSELAHVCTHPGEEPQARRECLIAGLERLGA